MDAGVNNRVKTIKNGRADSNGNIDVTVASTISGITMTFGVDGTAVNVVTYMTDREVADIKALFT